MLININTLQKYEFNIPTDNVSNINFFNALISASSDIIRNYVGFDFLSKDYIDFIDEKSGGRYLVLRNIPVLEIQNIYVNGSYYLGDYHLQKENGVVRLTDKVGNNTDIRVEYTAGYSEVPKDIEYACVELVQYLKKRVGNSLVGESSKNIDGVVTNIETSIPLNVLHILNRYKWKSVCV